MGDDDVLIDDKNPELRPLLNKKTSGTVYAYIESMDNIFHNYLTHEAQCMLLFTLGQKGRFWVMIF